MGFKEADPEASRAGLAETKGSGIPFWTPPAGEAGKAKTTRIRILPPRDDHPDNKYYFWVATHGNLPGARGPVRCPQKNDNLPCPACEIGNDLWQANRREDARKWFSSWRGLVNIIVLNAEGEVPSDPKVQVWGVPKTLLTDELEEKIAELPEGKRNIASLLAGRDVFVRRRGKDVQDTKYEIALAPNATAFLADNPDLLEKLGEEMIFLPSVYPATSELDISGLLEAKPRGALPPHVDPFDDDTVEGVFAEVLPAVPETYEAPAPTKSAPPFGDDDDDEDAAPPAAPAGTVSKEVSEARRRLAQRLGTA